MKTTHLVLLTGVIILISTALRAQVKIGDNPLQISDNRLLEIEENNQYFLVKDSSGMTIGRADDSNFPLMLKLFGYGESPSLFLPNTAGANGAQEYFLGTNDRGEVLEFPLQLDLNTTTNVGELSFDNGDDLFGSVQLDSVFTTDTQLTDSLNTIRTLVATSEASDGDTITGNEWIRNLQFTGPNSTILEITENIDATAPLTEQNIRSINFDPIFTTDVEFGDTLITIRNELADTAEVLRAFNFYLSDNTFSDPTRTASGGGVTNLTFDSLSEFNVINLPEVNIGTNTGDVNISSEDANVNINTLNGNTVIATSGYGIAASGNSNININGTSTFRSDGLNSIEGTTNIALSAGDTVSINANDNISVDGNVQLDDYGQGTKTGSESFLLGVDALGNVVDVDLDSIGGDAILSSPVDLDEDGTLETTVDEAIQASNREIDSTIYNFDGVLTDNRTLDGNTLDLTFDNLGTYSITNTTTLDVDATTVDLDGTTYTADYTTSNITTTGDNTIESNGGDVRVVSTDSIILQATNTDINASTNVSIDAGNDVLIDAVNAFGADGNTVSILADDTSLLRATNTNSISSTSANVSIQSGTSTDIMSTTSTNIDATTNVNVSAGDTVSINANDNVSVDGNVQLDDYGQGAKTGSESFLLGVDALGNVVDVDLDSIGGDAILSSPVDLDEDGTLETTVDEAIQASNREIDSTIYNFDGVLQSERTMDMNSFGLTFEGDSGDETQNIYITSDGRMAIGRNSVTSAIMSGREVKLDVNGDILAMQVHSSSDRRFKKNITTVSNAIEKVKEIRGVTYDFRTEEFTEKNFPKQEQLGFIAQELEEVIPQVVKTDGEGFKSVDYAKVTALLTQAIKEQQDIIDRQDKMIIKQSKDLQVQASVIDELNNKTDYILHLLSKNHNTSVEKTLAEE